MPKINIYLPDELADAVKAAGIPVSAVCQNALNEAVQRTTQVQEVLAEGIQSPDWFNQLTQFTQRSRHVLALSTEHAQQTGAPGVTGDHLLAAILDEGANLAVRVLNAAEVDTEQLLAELPSQFVTNSEARQLSHSPTTFEASAASILQKAVTEAISFGHNYVGCEHLLLAISDTEESHASQLIQAQGSDYRTLRRAVKAAVSGYAHLRTQKPQPGTTPSSADVRHVIESALEERLEPLRHRLTALENTLLP